MAQFDLLLTQNVHATGIEFIERWTTPIAKGCLISSDINHVPKVLPAGTDLYMLVRDNTTETGLKWVENTPLAKQHDQNTDVGTDSDTFYLGSSTQPLHLAAESNTKLSVKVHGGATYADMQVKDITAANLTVTVAAACSVAPSIPSHLTNKAYVDGLLAALSGSLLFKGNIKTTGGDITPVAFNALTTYNVGWQYRAAEAGTFKGNVCEVGDLITAIVSRTGTGALPADWTVSQTNIDGAVTGPASSVGDQIAVFNGTTGKIIKDGGTTIAALTTLITNAQITADGKVSSVSGTLPIVSSGGTTPIISINAATTGAAGSMSAADKLKLDNIEEGAGVSTPANLGLGTVTATEAPIINSFGSGVSLPLANAIGPLAGLMSGADKAKLDGITGYNLVKATSADVNTGTDNAKYVTSLAIAGSKILKWITLPALPANVVKNMAGEEGDVATDGNFFYVCTAANTWKRSPIATNW